MNQIIKEPNSDSFRTSEHIRQVKHSSKSNEWYTPQKYVDAARQVMGSIDLDPASNRVAQEWIQARCYYSLEDDGMQCPWFENIFLNPPYGRKNRAEGIYGANAWTTKATLEYEVGNVKQAILLLRLSGSKGIRALESKFPRCSAGRISFISEDFLGKSRPGHDSVFFYLGPHIELFREVFSEIGTVTIPHQFTSSPS